jgi:ribosome maturation factor RimP
MVKPLLESIGAKLYEASLVLEDGEHYLRIQIDKPGGAVGLDLIMQASELISPLLDQANLIPHQYILDISSAGAEHPIEIESLNQYVGDYVQIHLKNPVNGENILQGTLETVDENEFTISYKIKTRKINIKISRAELEKARLAIKF